MLGAVAREAAERFGDDTAYVSTDGSTLSYRDLSSLADRVAAGLSSAGVGEGDVVGLVLPQSPEHVIAYVAAARVGAITAAVNTRLAAPEQEKVLAIAQPKVVLRDVGSVRSLAAEAPPPAELAPDPDRPVALVFTSGTTGTPKGATFCERQLRFITDVDTHGEWGGGGATIAGTSFAHLGPMTKLPGSLMRGGATHLMARWRAPAALWMIVEHRMASFGGIPTQVALMLQQPDFDDLDVSCVRAIVLGGGPATPALVREARERFGAPVAIRYSCTEAGIGVGTAFDAPTEDAEVSVGRAHAGVEVSLRDAHDGVGEVCLRSPAIMAGYWRNRDATAEAMTADGFVRTGDLGWVDDAGRLRLVGRSKEMYVRGGYNVYPMEVEGVLAQHPGVADVAIVPRPDDVMGEVGVAVVVPRDPSAPPSLSSLRDVGAEQLATYKLPDDLRVVDALPLTAMEKLDRRALRGMI